VITKDLSAGRVQSVAVRLVVEREREIKKFVPQEYWSIIAKLKSRNSNIKNEEFEANLIKVGKKTIDKLEIKNKKEADEILNDLNNAEYKVASVENKEEKKNPLPPFTTSTLQQDAWKKFHFPSKFTMQIAQQLYERGYITYHRTDSLNLSESSLFSAKEFIIKNFGEKYWAGYFRKYKTKAKNAQEAHEAIRPAYPEKTSEILKEKEKLDANQFKLYNLIWKRFVASQMAQAQFDLTATDILAKNYTFRANGQVLKFEGFLKVYPIKFANNELPVLKKDEILDFVKLENFQHFTEPPARYNEASLIKMLEENGIGRPSTYAPIISTIQTRNYIEKDESKRFIPTEIGTVVNDILVKNFPEIVDIKFTAKMEEEFDEIAKDKKEWVPMIRDFYSPFEKNLDEKYKEVSKKQFTEKPTDEKCPECGSPLLIRLGRYGEFFACSNFPKCKFTRSMKENKLDVKCPKCGGEIVVKRTKRKKIFYGCKNWPKCDFASWDKPTGKNCEKCGSPLVETKKKQTKCSNKECDFKVEK
jgi:DNA topoisomerase-1